MYVKNLKNYCKNIFKNFKNNQRQRNPNKHFVLMIFLKPVGMFPWASEKILLCFLRIP